ncbi:MAG: penicillin-binding protein 2 [Fimbriimonadales bacterium]|nr:penicillin-binding protein 2 [Fimbriimonadales bacterium]MDW8051104.1 penicillin-binding protein 2 [Armatimonadota bacterium]
MIQRPKRYLGIRREEKRIISPREYGMLFVIFAVVGVLGVRLWYLQVLHGEELATRAELVRTRLLRTPPPRGLIVDRNGQIVATNRAQIVISVIPERLRRHPERIPLVAQRLGIAPDELRQLIENPKINPYIPLVVQKGVGLEQAADLLESQYNLPEVEVSLQPMRRYPYGGLFAHVLGYVGQISQEELQAYATETEEATDWLSLRLYDGTDFVGKSGIERTYERELHGKPGGEQVEVTPVGKRVRTVQEFEPTPGNRVVLSLDVRLQRKAHELLQGHKGALVALDPRTGEVLAMVSQPTFDPNVFVPRIPRTVWRQLANDPRAPLNNRAVQSAYAPGSIVKPIFALEGLKRGLITTHSHTTCTGGYRLGTRTFRCWRRHGRVDFYESIAFSCDVFYYQLAQRLGPDALAEVARAFGLGERTGIDLPHERKGLVPDTRWKRTVLKQPWYGGETLNYGIGQGYLAITPLQAAVMAMGIANRGVMYRPYLVKEVRTPEGRLLHRTQPEVIRRYEAAPEHWEAVIEGMVRVVEAGTASAARVPGIRVAGKTGSAEFRKGGKTHAWFIAFAPAENPRVVVCVMAEEAGGGGAIAAPIAGQWLRYFFELGY